MNILVLSWRDTKHPLAGGAEQVMHEHMKGWIAARNSVTLFASSFEGSKPKEMFDGVTIIRRGHELLGVQIAFFFWYLFVNKQKFDLIVDQFHGLPFFTPLFCRVKKIAVVQEVAREVWFFNHLSWPINKIIGSLGYVSEPFVYWLYRNTPFMTGSRSAQEDLIKIGIPQKNITIVPHGVVLDIPKPLPQKEKTRTIIFLGALARDKGIEDALKTFSLLNKSGDFNFWVVGKANQEYFATLKKMAKDLNIDKRTKFFGFVTQQTKFNLLARAHILVNPSIREGWGLVNIEANAVGTPVVAYDSPGLTDSVKSGVSGVICKTNSPKSLSQNIKNLLSDSKKLQDLQKSSVSWSKNFTWEKSRKKSLQLINAIITSSEI